MYNVKPTETDKRTFLLAFELEKDLLPPLQKVNIFKYIHLYKKKVLLRSKFSLEKKKLNGYVMQCQTCTNSNI